ncbi:MAG: 16S rRNA (uracil(1498)-N(3))-methyltransferase [Bacteroidetes bacterium]|nr:16S rRNA (uracil(1498)-N(3))-methyltransferase [Bacteroidota bacterium]
MDLPFFFAVEMAALGQTHLLGEEASRHAISVLRMTPGDPLVLVDGKGGMARAAVLEAHRKRCSVRILDKSLGPDSRYPLTLAVSLLKNAARFEWMFEKACELGVQRVIPLVVARTERQHQRMDRLQAIALSALQQSQQAWMTEISAPMDFQGLLSQEVRGHRLIAHCMPDPAMQNLMHVEGEVMMLVGPEGDFSPEEVSQALHAGFRAVRLGPTRLRSETAALVAATILCLGR